MWVGDYGGVLHVLAGGDRGRLGALFTPKQSCDPGTDKEEKGD